VVDMAEKTCSRCGRRFGILDTTTRVDDEYMCIPCYHEHNEDIIREYVAKYLSNKTQNPYEIGVLFDFCSQIVNGNLKLENISLVDVSSNSFIEQVKYYVDIMESPSTAESGLSSSDINAILNNKKRYGVLLDFLDDLEKLYKLIQKRNINVDYLDILTILVEYLDLDINEECDAILSPVFKLISRKSGMAITEEQIIHDFFEICQDKSIDIDGIRVEMSHRLLKKFNRDCDITKIGEWVEKAKEDLELREFEMNMGSQKKSTLGDFSELNGAEFEEYLEQFFSFLGYSVIKTPLTGDQGADLIIEKDGEKIVVQAKKYSGKVSNKAVQEIVGARNHYKADKGIVVTNSSFTKSAIELALTNDIELWDGEKIRGIIKELESGKNNSPTYSYMCDYCFEEFDTSHEAEEHEKKCDYKE